MLSALAVVSASLAACLLAAILGAGLSQSWELLRFAMLTPEAVSAGPGTWRCSSASSLSTPFGSSWFWFTLYTVPCSADLTLFVLPACYLIPLAWLPNLEQLRAPHQGQLELSWEGEFLVNLVNDRRYRSLAIKTAQCFSCWTYDVIDHTVINNTDSAARLVAFGQCHLGGCVTLSNVSTFLCLRMTK